MTRGTGGSTSDHLVNPRHLESRYTYSTSDDGSPSWGSDTPWPDSIVSIAAMAAATQNLLFTTAVYIAPPAISSRGRVRWAPPPCCRATGSAWASGWAGAKRNST